jgi:hypothetical protein
MKRFFSYKIVPLLFFILLFFLQGCAEKKYILGSISPPHPSSKLRVFVQPVSEPFSYQGRVWAWPRSPEEYWEAMYSKTSKYLQDTGVYEVVPEKDLIAVLGKKDLNLWGQDWQANNWQLAKQVAKVLHADYALIMVRANEGSFDSISFKMVLINVEKGKTFVFFDYISGLFPRAAKENLERYTSKVDVAYRQIFHDAKSDLLEVAVKKGRVAPSPSVPKETAKPEIIPDKKIASVAPPSVKPSVTQLPPPPLPPKEVNEPEPTIAKPAPPPEKKVAAITPPPPPPEKKVLATPPPAVVVPPAKTVEQKPLKKPVPKDTDKTKLVVYDFDAATNLNVVALILTEVLREELYILGQFQLVNRENLTQIMQELKLQQSGLVDDKQVVQIGNWLGANESVTGRLATLGNTYILSAKRTDINTLGTLSMGSLKCTTGKEEELLNGMPMLARKLAGKTNPDSLNK